MAPQLATDLLERMHTWGDVPTPEQAMMPQVLSQPVEQMRHPPLPFVQWSAEHGYHQKVLTEETRRKWTVSIPPNRGGAMPSETEIAAEARRKERAAALAAARERALEASQVAREAAWQEQQMEEATWEGQRGEEAEGYEDEEAEFEMVPIRRRTGGEAEVERATQLRRRGEPSRVPLAGRATRAAPPATAADMVADEYDDDGKGVLGDDELAHLRGAFAKAMGEAPHGGRDADRGERAKAPPAAVEAAEEEYEEYYEDGEEEAARATRASRVPRGAPTKLEADLGAFELEVERAAPKAERVAPRVEPHGMAERAIEAADDAARDAEDEEARMAAARGWSKQDEVRLNREVELARKAALGEIERNAARKASKANKPNLPGWLKARLAKKKDD